MTGQIPPPQYAPPFGPAPGRDEEHVKLLSIFHYVLAGIMGFFGCMPFIHVGLGLWMLASPGSFAGGSGSGPPPAFMPWMFVIMGSAMILAAWTVVILLIAAGTCLRRRTRRMFCIVVAGISCLFMPIGTVLGVFTIIVLSRPSVKALFEAHAEP
jgi:hypothetical protein